MIVFVKVLRESGMLTHQCIWMVHKVIACAILSTLVNSTDCDTCDTEAF